MLNVPQSEKTEQSTDNENSFHLSPPSLSLPQGGGALKGIGEKFSANPVTGTGSMAVPIATSPGRGGFGPQLALTYDSGAGNGPFGFGWNLSLPSITRKTDKGLPRYWDAEESDVFLLSGAEDLVPVAESGLATRAVAGNIYQIQRYRPRVEGLFVRIERWTNVADSQEVFWRSLSRDNISTWYGKDADSRIADTANPSHIFSWLICESHDDKGNVMVYRYQAENSDQVDLTQVHERNRTDESRSANRYLKSIRYGNHAPYLPVLSADASWPAPPGTDAAAASEDWFFEVVFDYGEHHRANPQPNDAGAWTLRADPFSAYRAGFEVRTYRLCRRVLMFHHFPGETGVGRNCLVRSTDFTYTDERSRIYTFLSAVQQRGYKRQGDEGYLTKSLPPVEFTYTMPQIDDTVQTVAPSSLENLPDGLDGARYQWVDLDGEGVTGILTEQGGGWFYKRNLSPINRAATATEPVTARFAPIERVSQKPPMGIAAGSQFMDLAGDGQLDLVTLRGATPGFYERTRDGEDWESFRAFRSLPVMDWDNPNLKFIDLDGDGHSDILITEDDCFMWHRSLAEEGFGDEEKAPQPWDEEKGPRVVFADGTQSIYLADLSGDGLTDIVRIRNGEVCYWPNQGYGRFGAKVTMDNAPWFDAPDQFSQDRIQLADIDGSGTTDILYLGGNGVQIYFNESGNHWADKQVLHSFPAIDNLAAVTVVDLLGTGTACLVWSSPLPGHQGRAMSYIELMGGEQIVERIDGSLLRLRGQKPHLLIQTRNNLGAETLVQYAPSTKFYLQDKLAGTPWITKLPFPIHVVEKVKVTDKWRQTTFSSTYSYHHGYFDGIEREFRGFGRVEQTDVEDFGQFTAGNRASPYIADDQTLYQPPVKTITWFHTGAFLDRQRILSQFQTEYFAPSSDDFTEATLPEPDLTTHDLSVEEWREALRACKGMMLRQEVYELDVDALANDGERRVKLFSTAFHNCHIQRLQARGEHRHAVFLVTESEAITYHYELDLRPESLQPDPRIAHTLNLSIDEVGNVLESVAVAYPRLGRHTDSTLPEGTEDLIEAVQQERHLVLTENRFTHDVMGDDAYRLRLPCEVKTYELTGINPEKSFYYTLAGVQAAVSGAALAEILYHVVPDRTTPQKRGVEWVRMLYFNDDLETPLPWGEINSLALPYETYKLALTDDLLSAVFETEYLTAEVRGNLNDPDESGYLSFDTSGQYWVRSGVAGFDTRTETHAATHFYLPERYTDAFGNTTTLSYDSRDLYVASSTDPVGNTTQVRQFDFRVLAPAELEDINGNRSQVYFDVLGLPTAMAMLGKGTDADGLSGFDDALANPDLADLTAFFNGGVYNEAQARQWLGSATARYVYHFGETAEADGNLTWGAQPAAACSIMREQHHAALEPGQISPLQVGFEYSDGMGTVLVQKVQAEPDPDDDSDNPPLRWIANGKTILNNKGNPVKQYEPYFSPSGHRFEEPMEVGVTAVIYYDAAGRQVRSEMPDGTYSRVEFSPWMMTPWDANDTVLEPNNEWYARRTDTTHPEFTEFNSPQNQRAARLAAVHANTPAVAHLDSLGREVVAVAHNKEPREATATEDKYVTFTKLDIEGKPLWIQDARGNRVMEYINAPGAETGFVPCYDIAGNLLFQHSMDGGDRWMLMDATGQPFYAWDENERVVEDGTSVLEQRRFHTVYDRLRRPVEQQLEVNDGAVQVVERLIYGDEVGLFPARPAEAIPEAQERNLRGQVYHHYDPSGVMTSQRFDFKGNLLEATRRLAADYQAAMLHWPENPPERMFEPETFIQRTQYDALNRMTRQANWHRADPDAAPPPAIYVPEYNQRGVLVSEQLTVRGAVTQAIEHIAYDAKGQRLRIDYGNNTITTYTYDPETFRLTHLQTTRTGGRRIYQDLHYTYDPVGNITEIRDDANELVFFNSQIVRPRNRYTYDALYRLIEAEGREQYSNSGAPPQKLPNAPKVTFPINSSTDPNALRNYTQRYRYDAVGNIMQMEHVAERGSWTRHYEYAPDSNRLLRTWQGGDRLNAVEYGYDTHGSMLNLANTPDAYRLRWDYRDMIHQVNLGGGGQAFYAYDAEKQRTRKRIEHLGENRSEERLYLGGMELYRRWLNGSLVEEIESHHLFADDQRILIAENVISTDNERLPEAVLYRYQYGNHLGSVSLEMTEDAEIISYEEYHPYGTTAYQARNRAVQAKAKQYRYTGMERDKETGLSYHTARFYLPWLGRWCSTDPIGIEEYINLYSYTWNNPEKFKDISGLQSTTTIESDEGQHIVTSSDSGPSARFYFVGGANNDQSGWNYIDRFRRILSEEGITGFHRINASGGQLADINFTGLFREHSWQYDRFGLLGGVFPISHTEAADRQEAVVGFTGIESAAYRFTHPAIEAALTQILSDLGDEAHSEIQINLAGYSYGSVLQAHVALRLADMGIQVDNLILIGSPISSDSLLYRELISDPNIVRVIRHDIPGDFLSNPSSDAEYAAGAFQNFEDSGPHFDLARPDDPSTESIDEGLEADERIRSLAQRLREMDIQ